MARIQILELPTEHHGDNMTTPFLLILDQLPADEDGAVAIRRDLSEAAQLTGARAVLAFDDTIEIPANEITLSDATDGNVVRIRVEPDLTGFTDTVMAEVARAQATAQAATL